MRQTFDDLTNRLLSILDLGSYKIQNYVGFGKVYDFVGSLSIFCKKDESIGIKLLFFLSNTS